MCDIWNRNPRSFEALRLPWSAQEWEPQGPGSCQQNRSHHLCLQHWCKWALEVKEVVEGLGKPWKWGTWQDLVHFCWSRHVLKIEEASDLSVLWGWWRDGVEPTEHPRRHPQDLAPRSPRQQRGRRVAPAVRRRVPSRPGGNEGGGAERAAHAARRGKGEEKV